MTGIGSLKPPTGHRVFTIMKQRAMNSSAYSYATHATWSKDSVTLSNDAM